MEEHNFDNLKNVEEEGDQSVGGENSKQGIKMFKLEDLGDKSESSSEFDSSDDEHLDHSVAVKGCDTCLDEDLDMTKNLHFNKIRKLKIAQREKEKIEQSTKKDVMVIEQDYLSDEICEVAMDVYNIFIAANMTKNCNP
jgi:hypothetical protein